MSLSKWCESGRALIPERSVTSHFYLELSGGADDQNFYSILASAIWAHGLTSHTLESVGLWWLVHKPITSQGYTSQRTVVYPEWRSVFFHYSFILNTITIQVKTTKTKITTRVVGLLVTTISPSSPGWIPGFKQQVLISPNSLLSLSHLRCGFQIHAFTDMLSHAG